MKRVCTDEAKKSSATRNIAIPQWSNEKDIMQAYYHLHKRDPNIMSKFDGIKTTWMDIKCETDALFQKWLSNIKSKKTKSKVNNV
jgi:hypothetical protein